MAKSDRRFRWFAPGQSVNIQGYEITDGLVYVGETSSTQNDSSSDFGIIDPGLETLPGDPRDYAYELRRGQRYTRITPNLRGAYLSWLADGRSDPKADIGYVYLFFHGLERRLLVDGLEEDNSVPANERAEIVQEVLRLNETYEVRGKFSEYAGNLILMEWIINHRELPVPVVFDRPSDVFICFNVVLAEHAAKNKPIPPELALQWIEFHPDCRLKATASLCDDQFKALFFHRYKKKYGEGLVVKPGNRPLRVKSYAAYHASEQFRWLPVPKLREIARPLDLREKVEAIVDICTKELEPFRRFVRDRENQANSLVTRDPLPEELMAQFQVVQIAKDRLASMCVSGAGLVSVGELYECFGEMPPQRMGNRDAKNLAVLVEGAGFGLAPDIRFHHMKPNPDGRAAIFTDRLGPDFHASRDFMRVGATLQLGAMISQVDGIHSRSSKAILRSQVTENSHLNQTERNSLLALLEWCLVTPQGLSGVKKRLARVDQDGIAMIRNALVLVAVANDRIEPSKVKLLEKLYPILGLTRRQVASDLHALQTGVEPKTVHWRDSGTSRPIPAPPALFSDERYQALKPHCERIMSLYLSEGHSEAWAVREIASILLRLFGPKVKQYFLAWIEHEFNPTLRSKRRAVHGDAVSAEERNPPASTDMIAGRKQGFTLNEELLRRREEETRQAKELLEEQFEERAEENITNTISPSGNPLDSLDKSHQYIFHQLIQQEEWERNDLRRLCEERGLMVEGTLEKLNEWFFDHVNTPLIEYGDPFLIYVESAKEIFNVNQ